MKAGDKVKLNREKWKTHIHFPAIHQSYPLEEVYTVEQMGYGLIIITSSGHTAAVSQFENWFVPYPHKKRVVKVSLP